MFDGIKIAPEFQSKSLPLTANEFQQLEENILSEGRILNPLIVWNGLLVDGHNRFAILQKHPELSFTVHEKEFADSYEAIVWICKNQLGRRNLTPEQKKYLIGKQYEAEKSCHGGDRKSTEAKSSAAKRHLNSKPKTCDRIAEENGVGRTYVKEAERYAKGVDAAEEVSPGIRLELLSRTIKPTASEVAAVARAPPEGRQALVSELRKPNADKKPPPQTHISESSLSAAESESSSATALQRHRGGTELQQIRALSDKMAYVESIADADGMLCEIEAAAQSMVFRLNNCFECYPELLNNSTLKARVLQILQLPKAYILKLEGDQQDEY